MSKNQTSFTDRRAKLLAFAPQPPYNLLNFSESALNAAETIRIFNASLSPQVLHLHGPLIQYYHQTNQTLSLQQTTVIISSSDYTCPLLCSKKCISTVHKSSTTPRPPHIQPHLQNIPPQTLHQIAPTNDFHLFSLHGQLCVGSTYNAVSSCKSVSSGAIYKSIGSFEKKSDSFFSFKNYRSNILKCSSATLRLV